MKNQLSWAKYTTLKDIEEIEEPMRIGVCFLYAVGIILTGLIGFALIVVGLSF